MWQLGLLIPGQAARRQAVASLPFRGHREAHRVRDWAYWVVIHLEVYLQAYRQLRVRDWERLRVRGWGRLRVRVPVAHLVRRAVALLVRRAVALLVRRAVAHRRAMRLGM